MIKEYLLTFNMVNDKQIYMGMVVYCKEFKVKEFHLHDE